MQNLLSENQYGACVLAGAGLAEVTKDAFTQWWLAELPQRTARYKLCWLVLPASATHLLPVALMHGFVYHSVQLDVLTLVFRLQPDAYLPLAATHSIGVGGAVFNQAGQILLIREQPLAGQPLGHWKLPGGMTEPGEHLVAALEREVMEETGIRARFCGWVAMRHHHKGQFGASNLYIVGRLETDEVVLQPDSAEIAAAAWFEPLVYLTDRSAHPYNQLLVRQAMQHERWLSLDLPGYQAGNAGFEIFAASD